MNANLPIPSGCSWGVQNELFIPTVGRVRLAKDNQPLRTSHSPPTRATCYPFVQVRKGCLLPSVNPAGDGKTACTANVPQILQSRQLLGKEEWYSVVMIYLLHMKPREKGLGRGHSESVIKGELRSPGAQAP